MALQEETVRLTFPKAKDDYSRLSPDTIWERLVGPLRVDLELDDNSIVPGQPIRFHWSARSVLGHQLDLGRVQGQLLLVRPNGNRFSDPLFTFSVAMNTPITPGPYTSPVLEIVPPDSLKGSVYTVGGGFSLRLVLTGGGSVPGPFFSSDFPLDVRYEAIDASWWTWNVPAMQHLFWKNDQYSVDGRFYNRSRFAQMRECTVTMMERDQPNGGPRSSQVETSYPPDIPKVVVGAGRGVDVSFGQAHISPKSFHWVTPGTFWRDSPTEHFYKYWPRIVVVDEFWNDYPEIDLENSTSVQVEVEVSQGKKVSQALALQNFLVASSAVGFSWNPIGAAIAGAATAAAATFGAIALDPPKPDSRYRDRVAIRPRRVSAAARRNEHIAPLVPVVALSLELAACLTALSKIEGKIAGARRAGSSSGLRIQREDHSALLDRLRKLAREARGSGPDAQLALASMSRPSLRETRARRDQLAKRGFRATWKQQFRAGGGTARAEVVVRALASTTKPRIFADTAAAVAALADGIATLAEVVATEHRTPG